MHDHIYDAETMRCVECGIANDSARLASSSIAKLATRTLPSSAFVREQLSANEQPPWRAA